MWKSSWEATFNDVKSWAVPEPGSWLKGEERRTSEKEGTAGKETGVVVSPSTIANKPRKGEAAATTDLKTKRTGDTSRVSCNDVMSWALFETDQWLDEDAPPEKVQAKDVGKSSMQRTFQRQVRIEPKTTAKSNIPAQCARDPIEEIEGTLFETDQWLNEDNQAEKTIGKAVGKPFEQQKPDQANGCGFIPEVESSNNTLSTRTPFPPKNPRSTELIKQKECLSMVPEGIAELPSASSASDLDVEVGGRPLQSNKANDPNTDHHSDISRSASSRSTSLAIIQRSSGQVEVGTKMTAAVFLPNFSAKASSDEFDNNVSSFDTFDVVHQKTVWRVRGFSEAEPKQGQTYFHELEAYSCKERGVHNEGRNVISICIPCFNEEAESLERTLKSLREQRVPPKTTFEIVILMDGLDHMSASMAAYINSLFGISLQNNEGIDPMRLLPSAQTVVIEPTADTAGARISYGGADGYGGIALVLKRTNQRKVNSHMWWLASHAKELACKFVLATDCGTYFTPMVVTRLSARLNQDSNLAAVTGFQRIMSSELQGDGMWYEELTRDPAGFILREIQRFDFESDQSITKSVFDSLGFMPVLPGPCALYRYAELGSMESGVMKEYFTLCGRQVDSLIFGNVQLAEDRIPSCLLVFRHGFVIGDKKPTTGFVRDALFYFESEKPLGQLVKQRRRWLNGTYASYMWTLREEWLKRGNHSWVKKATATWLTKLILVQGIFIRFCAPAIAACGLYVSGLVMSDFKASANIFENFDDTFRMLEQDQERLICAVTLSVTYLVLYAVFILGHTPRAVPAVHESHTGKWRSDRSSAYRLWLFALAIFVNAATTVMFVAFGFNQISNLSWARTPTITKVILVFVLLPFAVTLLEVTVNGGTGAFRGMVRSFPIYLPFALWFYVWLPGYATARVSDLSWGNRDDSGGDNESSVAKRRAETGLRISSFLVFCNFALFLIILGLMHVSTISLLRVVYLGIFLMSAHLVASVVDVTLRAFRLLLALFRPKPKPRRPTQVQVVAMPRFGQG